MQHMCADAKCKAGMGWAIVSAGKGQGRCHSRRDSSRSGDSRWVVSGRGHRRRKEDPKGRSDVTVDEKEDVTDAEIEGEDVTVAG